MLIGWMSPNKILLESDETPLTFGKLSEEQTTWISSMMPIGGTTGTIIFGFIVNKFGRKFPLIALIVPSITGWLLLIFPQNVYYFYLARFFQGFTIGASYVVTPVYLLEIADDRVRGLLGASLIINENLGVLLGYVLGGFCHYSVLPAFAIGLNVLFVVCFVWFPETPAFLLKQDKISKSEKSIQFYRNVRKGTHDTDVVVELVMGKLKRTITSMDSANVDGNRLKMSDITTRPGSKALLIATVLVMLSQFSGVFAMLNYASDIFKKSGSKLSPNLSSVLVQGVQTVGVCFVTTLVERAGRRFLYLTSTIGTSLGYVVMGVFLLLKFTGFEVEPFNWIPMVCVSYILFISSWAVSSLTFAVSAELLPQKLRELGITYCAILLGVLAFLVLKFYIALGEAIGEHNLMFIFASACLLGAIYIYVALPEIKGKSYEDIMNKLL
ncbi:hypothetical protein HA402_004422 [Bradysia odoriphaga]|nr:hypothetical protein HA402_004422 [Bradysia odoriphaga]